MGAMPIPAKAKNLTDSETWELLYQQNQQNEEIQQQEIPTENRTKEQRKEQQAQNKDNKDTPATETYKENATETI